MPLDRTRLLATLDRLAPDMTETLSGFVAAHSPSGAEQPAADYLKRQLLDLGLVCERIALDSRLIQDLPLFSCPGDPDNARYNLLALHLPRGEGGRSLLFNGHLDVVPTGPEALWTRAPATP
jgi:acetylornithine deacetylase